MKIVFLIYIISWILMYAASKEGNPYKSLKMSIDSRGMFKTIMFHLIMPLIFFNSLLEIVCKSIAEFIDCVLN